MEGRSDDCARWLCSLSTSRSISLWGIFHNISHSLELCALLYPKYTKAAIIRNIFGIGIKHVESINNIKKNRIFPGYFNRIAEALRDASADRESKHYRRFLWQQQSKRVFVV
jgi:hypothetical protein